MLAPRRLSLAYVSLVLFVAACWYPKAGQVPAATGPADLAAASARWPDTTAETLAAGRATFVAHCNSCHDYPDVQRIDEARWPDILVKMGKKADLDASDTQKVLRFVLVARARP